jgi:hypothetical protein
MSKLQTGLRRIKAQSHGPAVHDHAADLLARLQKASNAVLASVKAQLDAPRPASVAGKIGEDEQFAMVQALKSVRFEAQIRALFDVLGDGWASAQADYYRSLWVDFQAVFASSAPPWVTLDVKITKKELSTLTDMIQGLNMQSHINWLRDKTLFRMKSLVAKSYKEIPKVKKDYRAAYQDALSGAMDGMMRSIEGLLRGLFEATYEQAQGRFMAVLNG